MSLSRYIFLGISAHMQYLEKLISKYATTLQISSLFLRMCHFNLSKFVLPLFIICENFKMVVAFGFSYKRKRERDAHLSPAEIVVNILWWHYGGFMEVKWEQAREAESRGFAKTFALNAIRRNRNFPGTLPPPKSILFGPFRRRGARVRKHAWCIIPNNVISVEIGGKRSLASSRQNEIFINNNDVVVQKGSIVKVLFTNDYNDFENS